MEQENRSKFVSITIDESQLNGEPKLFGNMREESQAIRVGGWEFFRPASQLHESKDKDHKYYFSLPEESSNGTPYTVSLRRGVKQSDGSYINERMELTAVELKEFVLKNPRMIRFEVAPERLIGEPWQGENMKEPCQSISIGNGGKISRPVRTIHTDKTSGNIYFYLPETVYDESTKMPRDYTLTVYESQKQPDGSYLNVEQTITAKDLENYIRNNPMPIVYEVDSDCLSSVWYPDAFASVGLQDIDVYDGWKITRQADKLYPAGADKVRFYLPEMDMDGNELQVKLRRSIRNEDGSYEKQEMYVTPKELKKMFLESVRERELQEQNEQTQTPQSKRDAQQKKDEQPKQDEQEKKKPAARKPRSK